MPGVHPLDEVESPLDGRVDGRPGVRDVRPGGAEAVLVGHVVHGHRLALGRDEAVGAADHVDVLVAVVLRGAGLLTEGAVVLRKPEVDKIRTLLIRAFYKHEWYPHTS